MGFFKPCITSYATCFAQSKHGQSRFLSHISKNLHKRTSGLRIHKLKFGQQSTRYIRTNIRKCFYIKKWVPYILKKLDYYTHRILQQSREFPGKIPCLIYVQYGVQYPASNRIIVSRSLLYDETKRAEI